MALPSLASITTVNDVYAYASAEAADAAKKCPAAYQDYSDAVAIATEGMTQVFVDPSSESDYVNRTRDAIQKARQTWYAAGCADPNAGTASSSSGGGNVVTASVAGGGGGMKTIWLAIGALFGAMLLFGKKGKPGLLNKKRRSSKRRRRR